MVIIRFSHKTFKLVEIVLYTYLVNSTTWKYITPRTIDRHYTKMYEQQ